jgi:hypothetical protein
MGTAFLSGRVGQGRRRRRVWDRAFWSLDWAADYTVATGLGHFWVICFAKAKSQREF